MMVVKLPILKKELKNGEIIKTKEEIEVEIDTSFLAHLKWEEQFQKTVGYSLAVYTEMLYRILEDENKSKAHFLSLLKWLYCHVNSDKLPTFKDFCKMFDYEIVDEIIEKIVVVFDEVGKSVVSKKN